jgi:hypothetical protein
LNSAAPTSVASPIQSMGPKDSRKATIMPTAASAMAKAARRKAQKRRAWPSITMPHSVDTR